MSAFLGSRDGRHFAEEVVTALGGRAGMPDAIVAVVSAWMERLVGERIEDELGIPAGLPYLQGLVLMQVALLDLGPLGTPSHHMALALPLASRMDRPATE